MDKSVRTPARRRFTLAELPHYMLSSKQPVAIEQGYLAVTHQREIRLRKKANSYSLAVIPEGNAAYAERIPLSQIQFDQMWITTCGMRLKKLRYETYDDQQPFVLDVYSDHLEGLIVIEYIFDNRDQEIAFKPPMEALREVTHETDYQSATLAATGLPVSYMLDKRKREAERRERLKITENILPEPFTGFFAQRSLNAC